MPGRWRKAYDGCYVLNDDLMPDMVALLLLAYDTYGDKRYRDAVKRAEPWSERTSKRPVEPNGA
mgnify:CR=1 FL=1